MSISSARLKAGLQISPILDESVGSGGRDTSHSKSLLLAFSHLTVTAWSD